MPPSVYPVSRTNPPHTYKGFEVRIVPRDVVHFGYEIRSIGESPIRSPGAFLTERAALAAAYDFVDEVDRRMGLGPPEDSPEDTPEE